MSRCPDLIPDGRGGAAPGNEVCGTVAPADYLKAIALGLADQLHR
jgi:hypothetical protein